jgi:hypothetical protein
VAAGGGLDGFVSLLLLSVDGVLLLLDDPLEPEDSVVLLDDFDDE